MTDDETLGLDLHATQKPAVVAKVDEHGTLKYHLLGPSLTKAGQDSVDQQKVSEIIYNASKGSKYFNREEVKDKDLTDKIARITSRKKDVDRLDLNSDRRRADETIAELELTRDLSQYIVHIDCDAFYAAVEELDHPEYKDVPMAVGKGVLTTCNYHARKFGCRSGMAGFVAMKLCPQLICLPLNFEKYTSKAQEVRAVLARYDSNFESASIDEAYMNITEYCHEHRMTSAEVIVQLRAEVFKEARITVSCGIAANTRLAKICSNKNKPDNFFQLANDRASILAFMRDLPTRKVNGVGRVLERQLDAIGIRTCGDIYQHRSSLLKLFGEKTTHFLLEVFLGLGRTSVQPAEDYERKSVGTESTFRDLAGVEELREKLRWTASELEKDLLRTQFKGRTLVLKVKLHTYEVFTRQIAPPKAVQRADDLYHFSLPLLSKLQEEIPGMKLRLMGLRVTHLVSTKKSAVDFFRNQRRADAEGSDARHSYDAGQSGSESGHGDDDEEVVCDEDKRMHDRSRQSDPVKDQEPMWPCPVCNVCQAANDISFNQHIDFCLSRSAIAETVRETNDNSVARSQKRPSEGSQEDGGQTRRTVRRKSFFG